MWPEETVSPGHPTRMILQDLGRLLIAAGRKSAPVSGHIAQRNAVAQYQAAEGFFSAPSLAPFGASLTAGTGF